MEVSGRADTPRGRRGRGTPPGAFGAPLAMLSHEPRTPLGGIAGLTELRLAEQAGPLPTLLPRALRADS